MTNTERLKEAIKRSGLKKVFIAEKLGLTYQGYLNKETAKREFTATEIGIMKGLLNLSNRDVAEIFLLQK